ncbi:MAG: KR domain-containing protein, partial [Candidatus Limnocylindrus sp.]
MSVERCDVGQAAHLRRLVALIAPVEGVWHMAGVLADALLGEQSAMALAYVYSPKAHGAWGMHTATGVTNVRFEVSFSSIASLLGISGLANYAAANACLDALASHQRGRGRSATSVQWGPWAEVGMAARGTAAERMAVIEATSGFSRIEVAQGLATLRFVVHHGAPSVMGVMQVAWSRFVSARSSAVPAFLSVLAPPRSEGSVASSVAVSANGVQTISADMLLEVVRRLVGSREVDADTPLMEAGIDSLGAVELRKQLEEVVGPGTPLSSTLVFDHPTARQLSLAIQPDCACCPAADAMSPQTAISSQLEVYMESMSALFPAGVSSRQSVWRMVACNHNAVTEVPFARWDDHHIFGEPLRSRLRHGSFIVSAELVDTAAFRISHD